MAKKADRYFIVDGQHAFVPTDMPGIYAKTHPCIFFVACDYCDAKLGERCRGVDGKAWTSEVHYSRRTAGIEQVQSALAKNKRVGKLECLACGSDGEPERENGGAKKCNNCGADR